MLHGGERCRNPGDGAWESAVPSASRGCPWALSAVTHHPATHRSVWHFSMHILKYVSPLFCADSVCQLVFIWLQSRQVLGITY